MSWLTFVFKFDLLLIHIVHKSDFLEFLCKYLELKAETFTEFWTCLVVIRNIKIFTDVK